MYIYTYSATTQYVYIRYCVLLYLRSIGRRICVCLYILREHWLCDDKILGTINGGIIIFKIYDGERRMYTTIKRETEKNRVACVRAFYRCYQFQWKSTAREGFNSTRSLYLSLSHLNRGREETRGLRSREKWNWRIDSARNQNIGFESR